MHNYPAATLSGCLIRWKPINLGFCFIMLSSLVTLILSLGNERQTQVSITPCRRRRAEGGKAG